MSLFARLRPVLLWTSIFIASGSGQAVAQDADRGSSGLFGFGEEAAARFDDARIARGREIATGGAVAGGVDMKCMACHGLKGEGTGIVPGLAGLPYDYLYAQLAAYIGGERVNDVMAPIAARLAEAEKTAVLAYYASLPRPEGKPPADLDWQLARSGELLAYAGRRAPDGRDVTACVMCHEGIGDLAEIAIAPPLEGQPAAYIEAQLTAWKAGKRSGSPLGVMERIADAMTDAEIAAVAAFYASRTPSD
ncbi:c-type cytochrome [Stappia stellulata]|uniref:c-type cytochrome n=1 Tax=Stappia stellulata TaxID=71235 RepID=UPI000415F806|nr:c-type cytochrome [Stappia stellulata]